MDYEYNAGVPGPRGISGAAVDSVASQAVRDMCIVMHETSSSINLTELAGKIGNNNCFATLSIEELIEKGVCARTID